ncbi:DUF3050 domain-containing protein [Algoriphagus lutimaris]|uniref:DUF3050 domain-containing protein n=1 Tax=Algoriphagus lutimaris TaxID=613197 RepID=UPI00196A74B2|nr:DUF3050 domain-containing protein [Algoriphagus lutimaris]MBN3521371.1 DUF3050 domain-containing protein [Algoriphagus lutimaris]
MSTPLERLIQSVQTEREILLDHPIYKDLTSLEDFQVFMKYHVFAVWDFMSLLKSLQVKLTGINLPWVPASDPMIARLINDIVLAEESDEDGEGGYCSHFELYLRAMKEAGAETYDIDLMMQKLKSGADFLETMEEVQLPVFVRTFLKLNFEMVTKGKPHEVAASFTLGREDLIPDLFRKLVDELVKNQPEKLKTLSFYFDRHIHLDEEEHGPLAWRMVSFLIGDDPKKFEESEKAAREALQARKVLWDGIHRSIKEKKYELI